MIPPRSISPTVALLVAASVAGACGSGRGARKPTADELLTGDPLPLAVGATWTYDATVVTYDVAEDKERTRSLTWVTEVVAARPSEGGVVAYDIKGWISDLAGSWGEAPTPSTRTLLRSGGTFLWQAPQSATSGAVSLDGAEGWFSWPLTDGQRICPDGEGVYCWVAEATDSGYRLTYRTGPDDELPDPAGHRRGPLQLLAPRHDQRGHRGAGRLQGRRGHQLSRRGAARRCHAADDAGPRPDGAGR
ncbi:MAG: hypothetical protein R2939_06970 [Kofleriaceae bacterium]